MPQFVHVPGTTSLTWPRLTLPSSSRPPLITVSSPYVIAVISNSCWGSCILIKCACIQFGTICQFTVHH